MRESDLNHDSIRREQTDSLAMLLKDHATFTRQGPEFEAFDPSILKAVRAGRQGRAPLLLAFYLPQFHAFPENDRFWGDGFTEWHHLPRSLPRFPGHYQPRIPRDLGYYNLTMIETLAAQTELAQAAGIGGFAFYYYRFDHGRVMEKPLELFLSSDLNMPFVLIWANESWKRKRDGVSSKHSGDGASVEVTLAQNYPPEQESELLSDIARHLSDRRYIRISGRPLFVIYSPKDIPNARATISRWRDILTSKCGAQPLMFMAQTYDDYDPRVYGLDGALEFPPHKFMSRVKTSPISNAYSQDYAGRSCDYDEFVKFSLEEPSPDFTLIKTAVPGWDNEPRYPNCGYSLKELSPKKYQEWLTALIRRAMQHPVIDTPIVALNAWNEWAECAYLEPDIHYGSSFLNATARAYVAPLGTES